ncbi:LysM peptidoglycan-binding domain-containing protein [Pyxidicoccus sp. 3LG]
MLTEEPPDADAVAAALRPEDYEAHTVLGAGGDEEEGEGATSGQRLDEIASQRYGDPSLWRLIAALNGISDPNNLPAGQVLRLPTAEALRRVM